MSRTIALIGNPNCGKTTLFNRLTGSHQKVGNWTGVTTEKKEGFYLKDKSIKIIDLPGLYSLNAKSADEKAVLDFLKETKPNVIINVVDGTNLERNLYLTTELLELKIPIIIAVTFMDQLEKSGTTLNFDYVEGKLGCKVIGVNAIKGNNLEPLISASKNYNKLSNLKLDKVSSIERYDFIEKLLTKSLNKKKTPSEKFTEIADKILMNKYLGLPLLFLIVTLVYFLSIRIGGLIGEEISDVFNTLTINVNRYFNKHNVPNWICSLVTEAILNGFGVVLSFVPQILVLFVLLGIIEETGYASRAAFNIDRLFSSFGLGGRSFIPMILGCGCTVSGLMATRTIENEGEKYATIFLTPFMPCGAKTAVFGWFSSIFFGGSAIIAASMYFLAIISVIIGGKILQLFNKFNLTGGSFVMEIPPLRLPRIKDLLYIIIEKVKDYMTKAALIIFVVSVLLWALRSLGLNGYVGGDIESSFLYIIADKIKYLFYPLGATDWRATVALISGVFAKEAVIETLELLTNTPELLFNNSFSVYAFCSFILLSPPCAASIVSAYRELKSIKLLALMLVFQFVLGYGVAIIINMFGLLQKNNLLLSFFTVIIITLSAIIALKYLFKKNSCSICKGCSGDKRCQKKGKRSMI